MKMLEGKYGFFADGGASYHVTDWRTPRPWINVIANGRWGLTISQAGGGYSWLEHSMLNRATRWNQDIVRDQDGKFLLVRDEDTGKVWSVTPQPLKPAFDRYRCIHGLGYTTFETAVDGIAVEWTLFVPRELSCETWIVTVSNESSRPRELTLLSYFELLLGVFPDWHREFTKLFLRTSFDPDARALLVDSTLWTAPLVHDPGWNKDWPFRCFFVSDPAPSSFTCDKEEFFGRHGDWSDARARKARAFSNRTGTGFDPVAAEMFRLTLSPGEKKQLRFCLGIVDRSAFEAEFPRHVQGLGDAPRLLDETRAHWLDLCRRLTVETPDPAVNVLVNYWLKYQAISCRMLGRTAFYQCGGAFGFRDQLQDSQVFLTIDPARTRAQIVMHAGHQQQDGTVQHWWHPVSGEGRLTDISDDLLWLPYVTCAYVRETGDTGLLDEAAPYLDGGGGTVFEHCRRAIDKALGRMSPRGLALMGEGDWNDGLNGVGVRWKGESIWLSHFLVGVLNDFAGLCRAAGRGEEPARELESAAARLREALLAHAFEGEWFIRATTDEGRVLGSAACEEGRIYLNAQTWAVMNGVVSGEAAHRLLDAVEKHLYKDYGVLLFTPAYTRTDRSIGYLTRYSPGVRENGGVYTHAAIWAMYAQAKAGRSEKVHDTFRRLAPPVLSAADADRYAGEPYATPGNIEGPESLAEGRGAWTWYSGSAAWLYKATVDTLLGVYPENGELVVRPNLPAHWSGYTLEREFRGRRVRVEVARGPGGRLDTKITPVR